MKNLCALFTTLLLVACSEPPRQARSDFDPGPDCQEACAAGYRWALDEKITDRVKCRGESEYARGCRKAVDFSRPFAPE